MMKTPITQPCARWAEMLAVVSSVDLAPAAQAALRAHLATCPACAAVKADYQQMDARIRALPAVRPLDGLPPALLQLWTEEEQRLHGASRVFPSWSTEDGMRTSKEKNLSIPTVNPPPQHRPMRRLVSGVSAIAAVIVIAIIVTALVVSHDAKPTRTGTAPNTASSSQAWAALAHLTNAPGLPVIAPSNPQVVYEAQLASANLPTTVTLQRSDNDGASWQALPVPSGITQVQWAGFFVSPFAARTVFVEFNVVCPSAQAGASAPLIAFSSGADVCTLDYVSTNGGAHWSPVQWPVHGSDTSHTRLDAFYTNSSPFKTQGTHLYALLGVGIGSESSLVSSTDGGATWQFVDQQLVAQGNCVSDYAPTPTGATVFAIASPCGPLNAALKNYASRPDSASPEAGGGGNELWRSDDAGAHWTPVGAIPLGVDQHDLHVSLNSAGQPVLYDDGFLPPDNTIPPTVTRVSVDGGKTWQAAPLGTNGRYADSEILGTLSDGSIVEAFTNSKTHQDQLFAWKAGNAAWKQLSGDFQGTPQYLLVIPSGNGQDALWLVTSVSGTYSVQRLLLQ